MDFYVCYTVSGTYTTVNYGYSTSGWGDLITSYGGASITYDAWANFTTTYYNGARLKTALLSW